MTMPDSSKRTKRRRPTPAYTPESDVREALEAMDEAVMTTQEVDRIPLPLPLPLLRTVSGLYTWSQRLGPLPKIPERIPFDPPIPIPDRFPDPFPGPFPGPLPGPVPHRAGNGGHASMATSVDGRAAPGAAGARLSPILILRETLRLDVDGRYPQNLASGTIYRFLTARTHWIAQLTAQPDGSWTGPIFYTDGDTTAFPFTSVRITAVRSYFAASRSATVEFLGAGTSRVRTYKWTSSYHHPTEVEFDTVAGATAVTSIQTHAHPNRPPSLPSETLTIEKVFQRAGFNVTKGVDGPIPISGAGANQTWSDAEMHDAMQIYWSRFADRPQWAVWTLFAALHDMGNSLGGIMFDDIGPNHRQGTAVFSDSFIATPPTGETDTADWIARMRFWTAVHELGHTFNLAHSWQKVHPASWGNSWIPMVNEPEARSFMNYPFAVAGGESEFFESFEYRFSDQELTFMRHAPERFVQQGNAEWFVNHGFSQVRVSGSPTFALELRTNRGKAPTAHEAVHPFMDQVTVELKLTNATQEPQLVAAHMLEALDNVTLVVKREGGTAKLWRPFSTKCWHGSRQVLMPGQSIYAPVYLSAGDGGFYIAEPGRYVVQAALHLAEEDIVSNPLQLRVLPPRDYDEAAFAQDLFTEDVGRAFAFDGTHALDGANVVLREAADRFATNPVATHALVALAMPDTKAFRELRTDDAGKPLRFHGVDAEPDRARVMLEQAITDQPDAAARTLGHIDFGEYGTRFARTLEGGGDAKAAESVRSLVIDTLEKRGVKKAVLGKLRDRMK